MDGIHHENLPIQGGFDWKEAQNEMKSHSVGQFDTAMPEKVRQASSSIDRKYMGQDRTCGEGIMCSSLSRLDGGERCSGGFQDPCLLIIWRRLS